MALRDDPSWHMRKFVCMREENSCKVRKTRATIECISSHVLECLYALACSWERSIMIASNVGDFQLVVIEPGRGIYYASTFIFLEKVSASESLLELLFCSSSVDLHIEVYK